MQFDLVCIPIEPEDIISNADHGEPIHGTDM